MGAIIFRRPRWWCAATATALLSGATSGCASIASPVAYGEGGADGGVTDEAGPSLGPAIPDPLEPSDASLGGRVKLLFGTTCSGGPELFCHGQSAGGTRLELGNKGDVINVRSTERPDLVRVAPNDLAMSYLYLKVLEDGGVEGGRMPLGSPYDPRIESLVRTWIDAGAPTN